ncbi:arylesterase [Winogradskyella flava]|uniref:Arylesterase n=1 Tax=Winogradskyella flava TaxID=1884876 RepID=A0A842IQM8_9FLAO|nr:arylesterase [Winogradskyella flava]MBC2845111.1 arylesterase [Winogradskyella flava]
MLSKILKFCYFILVSLVLGCGENQNNSKDTPSTSEAEKAPEAKKSSAKTILCFGDSITAGYGLEDNNDAYPAVLQTKIDSLSLDYTVINSGVSGETTAGGKSRLSWILNQPIDIFLLELGGNDGLRGIPLTETSSNLQAIIDMIREKSPDTKIILAGMELPPNMGQDYTDEFRNIFYDLAKENDLAFIPFILKDVGGIAALNQNDGIHPTVEGHKIVGETVWEILKPMLEP